MPPRKVLNPKKENILKINPTKSRQQVRSPELQQEEAEDDEREIAGNTRLVELLKTIKCLSGNWWEIDLAKILDEYVEIISKVQVEIDGVETTIDFSKASYVIQNMANAYSKKVELLLELVEKFREDLRVYNTGGNLEGNTNADGRQKRNRKAVQRLGINAEDFDLDFLREVGKHSSSKNLRRLDPREARQNARSFPFITLPPWYLTNQNTSSATEGDAPGANKTPLMSLSGDMIGYMEDFRVNRPFHSSTGFVGYNFTEDDEDLEVPEVNPLILPTQGFANESASFHLPVGEDGLPNFLDPLNSLCDLPDLPDLGSDREDGCLTPVREIRTLQPRDPNAADNVKTEKKPVQTPPKRKFDCWSRIELYTVKMEEKPAKSGKTTLLPDGLRGNNRRNASISSSVNGHSKVRDVIKLLTAPTRSNNLSVKTTRMLIPEFVIESLSKVSELGQLVKKMKKEIPPQLSEDGEEEADIGDRYYEGQDDCLSDESFLQEPEVPLDNQNIFPSYQQEDIMSALQKSQLNATLAEDESISYMQLAQQRVAEYMAEAQEYLQKTDLAKRVADWHEAILPHLEESEKRPNFDIHEYGTFVLNKLTENLEKEWLHFGEVIQGKPASEVGRFFSATLQLANSLNIDIKDDGHLAIDTMHVKFLKSERHHECMDEGEAFQQQKKNGKRKNT